MWAILYFVHINSLLDLSMTSTSQSDLTQRLKLLSKEEIIAASPSTMFTRMDKRSRENLLARVAQLSEDEQRSISDVAHMKQRSFNVDGRSARKRRKIEGLSKTVGPGPDNSIEDEEEEWGEFLRVPKTEVIERCMANFVDHTSNEAVSRKICMSCARKVWKKDTTVSTVAQIPNRDLLFPFDAHESYVLTDGMLLHKKAIYDGSCGKEGYLCHDCLRDLWSHRTPKFSLANGLWIGDIPPELAALTILEKVLIARYYPAVYVIKLFPKKKGAKQWDSTSMYSGMRGNVSTYHLNMDDIHDLVEPNSFPPPPHLLTAVIVVTIIGPKGLREKTMPGFLKVRRVRV
jgi:hypothetical protein